jgi:hypothetical protein
VLYIAAAETEFDPRQAQVVGVRPGRGIHLLPVRRYLSEVPIVERVFRASLQTKPGGGLKDRPACERCGRPVKVTSDDYQSEELLCPHCASEAKVSAFIDYDTH